MREPLDERPYCSFCFALVSQARQPTYFHTHAELVRHYKNEHQDRVPSTRARNSSTEQECEWEEFEAFVKSMEGR